MPFPGAIDSLSNGTLLFSAIAAFFALLTLGRAPAWRHTVAKTGSILLLALLAVMEAGPLLLVGALVLLAASAGFLAQEGKAWVRAGLASLLAGHLAYAVLFASTGGGMEILVAQPWRAALPALGLLVTSLLAFRAPRSIQRLPVTAAAVTVLALMLAAATAPVPLVLIGAAFFLASDTVLAVKRFLFAQSSAQPAWICSATWIFLYLAQLSITLGILL